VTAQYPPGVADWLEANRGAHAGEVDGWWYCRYPVAAGLTVSAARCREGAILGVLEGLREEARAAAEEDCPGWQLAVLRDGTWPAQGHGRRVAATGLLRLRGLIGGAVPTEDEAALAGTAAAS
jgi:hypothetical protein